MKRNQFVDFLQNTLIPDLKESGYVETAEDFLTACRIINSQKREIEKLRAAIKNFKRELREVQL